MITRLLVKLFVKNAEDINNPKVRESYGKFAGAVGIFTNLILATAKVLVGFIFNSVAITADGVNNLSDAGASIVTLVGFKLAGKPDDDEHPFGHARYEYISGLVVSLIVIVLGVQLIQQAIVKIINPDPFEFSFISAIVLLVAAGVKVWQAFFYRNIGKRINSTTIKATSIDSRNDVITSMVVLVSIVIGKIFGIQLDGIMGAFVGVFIAYSGVCLVKETSGVLLGLAPNKELFDKIERMIKSYDGVLGTHDLVVHEYGAGKMFATVHVEVSSSDDFMECHDLIDNIEKHIGEELGIHFVIHLDPVNMNDEFTLMLKSVVQRILTDIDGRINLHDFRVVLGNTHTNLIFDVLVPRKFSLTDSELKQLICKTVKDYDEKYYTVITVDRSYSS